MISDGESSLFGKIAMAQCILCDSMAQDISQELGCKYILTVGGLKKEEKIELPELYCTASDTETLQEALDLGVKIMKGHIFGVAGLLVGLCKLRTMKGLCLLAETSIYPDAVATREILKVINTMLHLKVNLEKLSEAAEERSEILKSFGIVSSVEKRIGKRISAGLFSCCFFSEQPVDSLYALGYWT